VFDHLVSGFVPCLGSSDQIRAIKEQAGIKVAGKLHQPLVSLIRSIRETA
jgi:hypothetical protein